MIYNQLKKVLDNVDFLTQNVFNSVSFAIGSYKQVIMGGFRILDKGGVKKYMALFLPPPLY